MKTPLTMLENMALCGFIRRADLTAATNDALLQAVLILRGKEEELFSKAHFSDAATRLVKHARGYVGAQLTAARLDALRAQPAEQFAFALEHCARKHEMLDDCNAGMIRAVRFGELGAPLPHELFEGVVYGIHDGGELLYVGCTNNPINQRLHDHIRRRSAVGLWIAEQGPGAVSVVMFPLGKGLRDDRDDYSWMRLIEKHLIKLLQPRFNQVGIVNPRLNVA